MCIRDRPYHVRTPAGLKTRYVPALIHHRGPVFDLGGGDLHSWTIGGYRDFGGLYQLYEMGRARDAGAFQAALLMQQIPCFHVLYADRAGTLFYLYNAKAGSRDLLPEVYAQRERAGMGPLTWQEPVSAIYHSAAWGGTIAPDALPYVMNPESGYLQACGNPPWTATDNAGLDAAAWPDWFFQDADTYRAQRVRRRGALVEMFVHQAVGRRRVKRDAAGHELVHRHAERVLVGSRGRWLRAPLFGGHVQRRAQHRPRRRERAGVRQQLGDPKVHQEGVAVIVEHDVGRLDVAVDHALVMCVIKRPGDLPELSLIHI